MEAPPPEWPQKAPPLQSLQFLHLLQSDSWDVICSTDFAFALVIDADSLPHNQTPPAQMNHPTHEMIKEVVAALEFQQQLCTQRASGLIIVSFAADRL